MTVVHGARELRDVMRRLGADASRGVITEATRAGAEVIRVEAERHAPRRTGRLASNIVVKMGQRLQGALAWIGPAKTAWYAVFAEFGTRTHVIRPKQKRAMATRDGTIIGTRAEHPGTSARPFLRPALYGNESRVMDVMGRRLWERIDMLTRRGG